MFVFEDQIFSVSTVQVATTVSFASLECRMLLVTSVPLVAPPTHGRRTLSKGESKFSFAFYFIERILQALQRLRSVSSDPA